MARALGALSLLAVAARAKMCYNPGATGRNGSPVYAESAVHTTNYTSTFIEVADDCKVEAGAVPPEKQAKTVAQMQFELISAHPYAYTSDEVIFMIYAARNQVAPEDLEAARAEFFSKGQPCLRSSPLAKTYGWGIHYDAEARIAIYPRGSEEYARLRADPSLKQLKAMRSAR